MLYAIIELVLACCRSVGGIAFYDTLAERIVSTVAKNCRSLVQRPRLEALFSKAIFSFLFSYYSLIANIQPHPLPCVSS